MRVASLTSLLFALAAALAVAPEVPMARSDVTQPLPAPDRWGTRALETLLQERLSVRAFAPDTLSPAQLGQLLWATAGITQTHDVPHRTVPSAGALYPLELYLLTARGVAHYDATAHALTWLQDRDRRTDLARVALDQTSVEEAPAVIVIAAEPRRTERKYEGRAQRYVFMEAGCACQNLLLEATALHLGAVAIGAFDDDAVNRVLELPKARRALLIVPVGRAR